MNDCGDIAWVSDRGIVFVNNYIANADRLACCMNCKHWDLEEACCTNTEDCESTYWHKGRPVCAHWEMYE